MIDAIDKIILSEDQLSETVSRLGERISKDYEGKNLLMIGVLKGAVVFLADLMRKITIPCKIDFMTLSSYNGGTKSSGVVKITKDLDTPLEGYDVLIVEDILDSGMTLNYTLKLLKARNPKSIKVCTLLDKPSKRKVPIDVDYIGCEIPDEFIIGYGLDYDEKYRNLPFIGVPKKEIYS